MCKKLKKQIITKITLRININENIIYNKIKKSSVYPIHKIIELNIFTKSKNITLVTNPTFNLNKKVGNQFSTKATPITNTTQLHQIRIQN